MAEWSYPRSVDRGYFISPRAVLDPGSFTVMATDVPLAALRRQTGAGKGHRNWKRARLTPIHENEEMTRAPSMVSLPGDMGRIGRSTPRRTLQDNSAEIRKSISPLKSPLSGLFLDRSDTPVTIRKTRRVLDKDEDKVEDELANILEGDTNIHVRDPEVQKRLAELPPRPMCKRKVLPPSVTNSDVIEKRNKVLRMRHKLERSLETHKSAQKNSQVKDDNIAEYTKSSKPAALKDVQKKGHDIIQAKSSDNEVCVLTLNDLKKISDANRPVVPGISPRKRHAKGNEDRSTESSNFDESGAISTPRFGNPGKLTHEEVEEDKCLKGTDITPFYNMWDRDNTRRPFAKKLPEKIPLYRSCMCALRNAANRNCRAHHLPPL